MYYSSEHSPALFQTQKETTVLKNNAWTMTVGPDEAPDFNGKHSPVFQPFALKEPEMREESFSQAAPSIVCR